MASAGEFLRSKREHLQPASSRGVQRRRRTPGLRREEVAELAGLSVDWYTRLEQDRALQPSAAVLEALSRALKLNPGERRYLFQLARQTVPPPRPSPSDLHPALAAALASISEQPVLVVGPRQECLGLNALGKALFAGFGEHPRFGMSGPWFVLCDPQARALYPEYRKVARELVGALRGSFARHAQDALFLELIDELSRQSPLFVELWSEQYVSDKTPSRKRFSHPLAGELDFDLHGLAAPDSLDQLLLLYIPRDAATQAGVERLAQTNGHPQPAPTSGR